MHTKKIAIYVEGQAEQAFLNHLILTRWNYTGIKILNLKLHSYQDSKSKVPHFLPNTQNEPFVSFVIIDVAGVGSLPSAIASRAKNEQEKGFIILALRDLAAQDFHSLPDHIDRKNWIVQKFTKALITSGCSEPHEIELFFSVMTIETWLLAFTQAASVWAHSNKESILKFTSGLDLESIKNPTNLFKKIGKERSDDPKSFHGMTSFIAGITAEEIESVYKAKKVPHFNQFWERLITLCE